PRARSSFHLRRAFSPWPRGVSSRAARAPCREHRPAIDSRAMPRDPRPGRRRERKQRDRAAGVTPKPKATPGLALHGEATISAAETRLETRIANALIAAAALVLLVLALGPHRIGDYFTETDFYGDYAKGARLIQHGRLIATRYGVV